MAWQWRLLSREALLLALALLSLLCELSGHAHQSYSAVPVQNLRGRTGALKSDDESPYPAHPIASSLPLLLLDGSWMVTRAGGTGAAPPPLPAVVPGDILSDLQRAGRAPDPYFNLTWRDPEYVALWNTGTWTYRKSFETPTTVTAAAATAAAGVKQLQLLVFDGIRSQNYPSNLPSLVIV